MQATARTRVPIGQAQFLLLLAAMVSLGCGLAITFITARSVPPNALGLFALVATILTVARDATDLGTANVTARRIVDAPLEEKSALADLLGWRAGPCIVAALILLVVAANEQNGARQIVWLSAALCILLYVNHAFAALFQARERLDVPARLNIATQVAALAACALLATTSAKVQAFALLIILREGSFVLLLAAAARRELGYKIRPNFTMLRPDRAFGSVGKVAIAALTYQIGLVWPLAQLSWAADDRQLGEYGLAFRLVAPFFSLAWILATPLVPVFAEAPAADIRWRRFGKALVVPAAAAGICCLGLWLASDALVVTLFGEAYAGAARPLAVLGLAGFANLVAALAVTALIASGADDRVIRLGLAALGGAVISSAVLIPVFGAVGAALSLAITLAAVACGAVAWLRHG